MIASALPDCEPDKTNIKGEAMVLLRYYSDIRRVAAKILGPSSELHDVVHDSIVRALEKTSALRDPTKLRSWLVGITVRVAHEHLRHLRRFPIPVDQPPPRSVIPNPYARIEFRRVFELLDELPSDDRVAFSLRHVEGMDLKTVAFATGVSLATAKRRIRRGADAFVAAASRDPALRGRIAGGAKWSCSPPPCVAHPVSSSGARADSRAAVSSSVVLAPSRN